MADEEKKEAGQEEEKKPQRPQFPHWYGSRMKKQGEKDNKFLTALWEELEKQGYQNPTYTVAVMRSGLLMSLQGIYVKVRSNTDGEPYTGNDWHNLLYTYQNAAVSGVT